MRTIRAIAVLLASATLAALAPGRFAAAPSDRHNDVMSHATSHAADADTVRYVVATTGNEARYRVREQLARINFPSDAVGTTSNVTGALVLDERGAIVAAQSRFTIELGSLVSDSDRRDNFIRRNTLGTADHAHAVFIPTSVRGLPAPLPASGSATFQLVGDLTVREVTKPVVWEVEARFEQNAVTGLAKTSFTFADFSLTKPRVASVLSVDDDIRLEYEFRLTREAQRR